jgi:hypothetical protein
LSDAELAGMIDAADVVVLPYGRSWNSGLAVLTLERRRRLLCSDLAGFRELAAEAGSYWVTIAEGGITGATLDALSRSLPTAADEARLDQFIAARQWDEIGRQTRDFYEQLLERGTPAGAAGRIEHDAAQATPSTSA